MNNKEKYFYTKDHEWIAFDNGEATVGITDFAQEELGEIVFVELPTIGKEFKQGEAFCVVESTKAASDVYAPLTGKIIAVNESLNDKPSLINRDPYASGFLVKFAEVVETETDKLLSYSDYSTYLESKK
jgi:glycine cleavage system H protein